MKASGVALAFVAAMLLFVAGGGANASEVGTAGAQAIGRGDLRCDASVDAGDSLALATYLGGLAIPAVPGCNDIGEVTYTRNGRIAYAYEGNIWSMNPDGSDQQQLTDDPEYDWGPAYSADGSKLAFVRYDGLSDNIWVMNADGSAQAEIIATANFENTPTWSPDGMKIAYSVFDGDQNDVWVADSDGSNQVNLTTDNPTLDDFSPDYSPGGDRIVFSADRDGNYTDLYTMAATGGDVQPLVIGGGYKSAASWSPDGTQIVYYEATGGLGGFDIMAVDSGGGTGTALTDDPARDADPEWSPDGKQIVFYSRRDNVDPMGCGPCNEEIYVMDANGENEARITDSAPEDEYPSWQALPETWGDLDCDDDVDADDLIVSLKSAAQLPAGLPDGCGPLID